jgi:hypothetical protein
MDTTIDGITYTQDANGDWNGSDGSTFTNSDFQNYASQSGIGTNYTTGNNSGTVNVDAPAGAVGQSNGNWINAAGQILGPIVVSAATPYLNNIASGGLLNTGTNMLVAGGNALNNISAPDLTRLIPQLRLQVMQGTMTPAQATAAIQQASQMNNVQTDQTSLANQRDALSKLSQIGNNNGMTEADRAALAETMAQTNANAASQRAAQIQQLQSEGNAGTGAELAARLSGVQGSANNNALAGANVAQSAQARALAALQASLQGNANLNTQQFNQQAQKAQAQDLVNQFNAQAQQNVNLANAGYQQAANTNNFNTANTIAGTNTDIMNKQALMPLNAANQNFQNQLGLGTAQSKAMTTAGTPIVNAATNQITRSTNAAGAAPASGTGVPSSSSDNQDPLTKAISGGISSGIGSAVSSGLGSLGSAIGSAFGFKDGGYVEPINRNEVSDSDIDDMMAKLTAYKYRYKGQ